MRGIRTTEPGSDTSEDVVITLLSRTNLYRPASFARLQKIGPAGLAWLTMTLLVFSTTGTASAQQSFKTAAGLPMRS
jgi:hypothetical protein